MRPRPRLRIVLDLANRAPLFQIVLMLCRRPFVYAFPPLPVPFRKFGKMTLANPDVCQVRRLGVIGKAGRRTVPGIMCSEVQPALDPVAQPQQIMSGFFSISRGPWLQA